jgi:polyisoprenoid-binding protein YceI
MKQIFTVLAAAALFAACNNAPEADKATATEQQTASADSINFTIDTATSKVNWVGSKPTGKHTGYFLLSNGGFAVNNGTITGGNFTINTNSLFVTDLTGEDKGKLEGHLKSADFFNTEKYATARFEITGVQPYDSAAATVKLAGATHVISGNLTLLDSTKNISFPAKVSVTDAAITADASFNINRTNWGLNYKGPNNPQDWFISKEVNLTLNITANKK